MQRTPLYDEHLALGGKVVDFHGWALPVQFAGIVQEHTHTRTQASLFDCSHMGEFVVKGVDAIRAYAGLITSDLDALRVGRARYGLMLNDKGGIIDDIVTIRLADDELYVVTNAGPLEAVSGRICGAHAGCRDVSASTAKIDIQGPIARDILVRELPEAAELKYFEARRTHWQGSEIVLSRTGYTGEMGFELFVPADIAVDVWRRLLSHEGVAPAGLGARDTLRTEMGYSLSGQDFDESRTPLEASLDTFIAWNTEFVGKQALEAQKNAGGYDRLTAIRTGDRRSPRHEFEVQDGDARVGVVTSGTFGPSVGCGIGLAYLKPAYAVAGRTLTAGPKGLSIETAELPFYRQGTCRK
ncbi:MAG: glycine cleavage system aminomethyltransferase GcvT [Candidatus Hydrogenedentes bacterium]|nr:glycine cleavage system aminomethyltransferase GcvT [Candidatus Hydrogenedentota bacterium]